MCFAQSENVVRPSRWIEKWLFLLALSRPAGPPGSLLVLRYENTTPPIATGLFVVILVDEYHNTNLNRIFVRAESKIMVDGGSSVMTIVGD